MTRYVRCKSNHLCDDTECAYRRPTAGSPIEEGFCNVLKKYVNIIYIDIDKLEPNFQFARKKHGY